MRAAGLIVALLGLAGGIAWVFLARGPAASAPASDDVPAELRDIQIEDKPGTPLPGTLTFLRHDGAPVQLIDVLDRERPTVVVLAYYSCPMLCTVVMNGLLDGIKGLAAKDPAWQLGRQYKLVSVSIDPRDSVERAAKKRANYLLSYGGDGQDWDFLVDPTGKQSRALADALGFHYRWDARQEQFAHAAGAFVIAPNGKLSRTLYGITFAPDTLKLALVEASQGKFGSAWDKLRLFCYHYDPNARGYVASAWRIMRLGGLLTVFFITLLLGNIWLRKSKPAIAKGMA